MESKEIKLEDKLYDDGLQLLANGHRMSYVFKHVRDRAESDEMRQKVMERLTANESVQEVNQVRLEDVVTGKNRSKSKLFIEIGVIIFALVLMKVLWDSGWIASLPLLIIIFVFLNRGR